MLSALFAFEGWIVVTNLANEVKNPERDLSKAIIFGLSAITLIYILVNYTFLTILPIHELVNNNNAAFEASMKLFGQFGGKLVTVGILISVYGAVNAFMLTGMRTPYILAQDNLLPFSEKIGKANIHTAGHIQKAGDWQKVEEGRFMKLTGPDHNAFIESMAEAAKSVSDFFGHGEKMLYISVMNNMSVDCDCVSHPAEVDMKDIGVLASLNPVALDQACVDLVHEAPDGHSLIERMESRNGELILKHAEAIGFAERRYRLVCID